MKANLQGKSVVFICVKSFNFEGFIVNRLLEMGADVRYFDERTSNTWFEKAIIRFKKEWVSKRIKRYYNAILEQLKDFNPDYLFVIRGEVVPPFFLVEFKRSWPQSRSIFYHADSFLNNPNPRELLKYFDKAATFDPIDSNKYNLIHLPLFFDDYYLNQDIPFNVRKYDISFIGTLHSDRAIFVEKVLDNFPGKKKFVFYYSHGLLGLIYHIIKTKQVSLTALRNVHFKPLSTDKTRLVFLNSKVVIDVEHPNQTGLTSRTIEALGAGCKVITTNSAVNEADFYHPNNICAVDRRNPDVPQAFLKADYIPVYEDVRRSYTLRSWLNFLFALNEDE